jgi:hypothetical protein
MASRRLKKRKVVSTRIRKEADLRLTRGEKTSRARRRKRFAAEASQ